MNRLSDTSATHHFSSGRCSRNDGGGSSICLDTSFEERKRPVRPRLKKSRSNSSVRFVRASSLANATETMVLPTPPLPLTTEMISTSRIAACLLRAASVHARPVVVDLRFCLLQEHQFLRRRRQLQEGIHVEDQRNEKDDDGTENHHCAGNDGDHMRARQHEVVGKIHRAG